MASLIQHIVRTESEHWRPVVGFTGYEVSDRGRVRSLDRVIQTARGSSMRRGVILKQNLSRADSGGRWTVWLYRNGKDYPRRVHVLVLEAFVGPRPAGLEGCHNDGDRDNNTVKNLRWDTKSSNQYDCVRHGTHHQTNKTHCPQGHPYTPDNTILCNTNSRRCRTCAREHGRRYMREVGTPRNRAAHMALRGSAFGVHHNTLKTHCKRGHPLSGDNLYIPKSGKRECRSCRRDAQRRHRTQGVAS